MMRCLRCGTQIEPSSHRCSTCGSIVNDTFTNQLETSRVIVGERPPSSAVTASREPGRNLSVSIGQYSESSGLFPPSSPRIAPAHQMTPIEPGMQLDGGRYRLLKKQEYHQWQGGAYETKWIARDSQQGGREVVLWEVLLPGRQLEVMQSALLPAIRAFSSLSFSAPPNIPRLQNIFKEQQRNFFAFSFTEGESLLSRMRSKGGRLQEQELVECCLQIAEKLETLSQFSITHGLICPEHILLERASSTWTLVDFSIIVGGGAIQYIAGRDPHQISPYTAPEFTRGSIDVRSDLYALLATMHHAASGIPPSMRSNLQGRHANLPVSTQFNSILAKGLHQDPNQRYQRPSELRQDLLPLSPRGFSQVQGHQGSARAPQTLRRTVERPPSTQPFMQKGQIGEDSVAQIVSSAFQGTQQQSFLPPSEDLSASQPGRDLLLAVCWMVVILIFVAFPVLLS